MRIAFVPTGATIDKDYPRARGGDAFASRDPAAERRMQRRQRLPTHARGQTYARTARRSLTRGVLGA